MQTLIRHLLAIGVLIGLIFLFLQGRESVHALHRYNRAIADASYVLLCLTLILGPLAKFIPSLRFLLPWRRELGIAFAVSAVLHVIIYASSFRWNLLRFFTEANEGRQIILREDAFSISNFIGLVALIYSIVLGLISNDFSQRYLGKGWKFLQQQSYTIFVLVLFHIVIYLYYVFNPEEAAGNFHPVFIWVGLFTILVQTAGYIITVWQQGRLRRRRQQKA